MVSQKAYAPGDVYVLRPYSTYLNDPDWHRHALLEHHVDDQSAGLLYASSQDTLKKQGASFHLIKPSGPREVNNGLTVDTYFYGSVLVYAEEAELSKKRGSVAAQLTDLRKAFRRAMGYRTGSGYAQPAGDKSLRGMIIHATSAHEALFGTCFFALLTEHKYSNRRKHQIVVPLYNDLDWDNDLPLIATTAATRNALRTKAKRFSAPGFLVHSIWHRDTVHSETGTYIDSDHMALIEDGICDALSA